MRKEILISLFILVLAVYSANSQQSRTLFFMHDLPQSAYTNPAVQPSCKFFLGIPALASNYMNVSSTALSYSDLTAGGEVIIADNIVKSLLSVNFLTAEVHANLISLGLKHNDYYFSFNIAEKISLKGFYPKVLFELASKGNDHLVGESIFTKGLGASGYHLREYSFGVAQDVDWNYKWGLKAKMLFGKANLNTVNSNIGFSTERDSYNLLTTWAYQLNLAFPSVSFSTDPNGEVDVESFEVGNINWLSYLFNRNSMGFAVDFGVVYLTESLTWSASVLDLGFINWRSNINNFSNKGTIAFDGITVDDSFEPDEFLQMISDSLNNQLSVFQSADSYITALPTKINLGATYEIMPQLNAGVLFRTEFYPRRPVPSLTFSLNTVQLNHIAASVSYSIMNGSYNNFGMGLGVGYGNFTFHALSDNFLAFFRPERAHTANLRFGLHLLFGCREKPKSFKYSGPGCFWEN